MSAVTDVRVNVSWTRHHKRFRLQEALGPAGPLALLDLWLWTGANKPTGRLERMSVRDIEWAADWRGEAGALVAALLEVGLLDQDGAIYSLHDWDEHQGWASGAGRRSEAARRANAARWSGSDPVGLRPDSDRTPTRTPDAIRPDSPSPSPILSSPNLSASDPDPSPLPAPPAQSSRAWGPARFREAWQAVTASTAPIPDDVAREGADATAKSAAALGCEPAERARVLIRAFVDLEACYREAGQKGLVGHAPPSRSAAAFVRGASGRWWGEAEQWCGGWRPRFAAAPPGASRAVPGAEVAPRHYDDAKTTAAKIRAWQEDRTPQGDDAAKVKDLMRGLVASIHGAP